MNTDTILLMFISFCGGLIVASAVIWAVISYYQRKDEKEYQQWKRMQRIMERN